MALLAFGALHAHAKKVRFCGTVTESSVTKIRCSARHVSHLKRLKRFRVLRELNFTRSGLRHLGSLPHLSSLRVLSVNYTRVQTLKPLAKMRFLEDLDASNTRISNLEGVEELANLKNLTLWNVAIRDLGPLSSLRNLRSLVLGGSQVHDLAPLKELSELQFLNVEKTRIETLKPLLKHTNLKRLYLTHTPVSRLELNVLKAALPTLQVSGCDQPGPMPCIVPRASRPPACEILKGCCDALEKRHRIFRAKCKSLSDTLETLSESGPKSHELMTRVCVHGVRGFRDTLGDKAPASCRTRD
jgi:Leucine-rich repeat (LRR) protein